MAVSRHAKRQVASCRASTDADLLGSSEIWLIQPMNDGLVTTYERFGYVAQSNKLGKVTHLSMRLNDET